MQECKQRDADTQSPGIQRGRASVPNIAHSLPDPKLILLGPGILQHVTLENGMEWEDRRGSCGKMLLERASGALIVWKTSCGLVLCGHELVGTTVEVLHQSMVNSVHSIWGWGES